MIYEALRVLVFGMLGIFVVMGIIMCVLYILNKISKQKPPGEIEEGR